MFHNNRKAMFILISIMALALAAMACALTGQSDGSDASGGGEPPKLSLGEPEAGETKTAEKDGVTMVYVPGGKFVMGAREFDEAAEADEIPMRDVTVKGFWIDQTEVTNEMFAAFLTEEGNQTEGSAPWYEVDSEDAFLYVEGPNWVVWEGFEDNPVNEVTWFGAKAYCEWVGRRLPTEAEWEKAARGTEGIIYPWGNELPNCSVVNYFNGDKLCHEGSQPVGTYPAGASPYNVYDMAGNIWEWVADWYDDNYYEDAPGEDPMGPQTGTQKVFRGGAWESGPRNLRTSDRNSDQPNAARYRLGFRCALSP